MCGGQKSVAGSQGKTGDRGLESGVGNQRSVKPVSEIAGIETMLG